MLIPEGLLDRVQLAVLGQALDRRQAAALGLDGEHGAALDRLAVDQDRARAALARIASDMSACEPQVVSEIVHEQQARLDLMLVPAAVDGCRDLVFHHSSLTPGNGARAAPISTQRR